MSTFDQLNREYAERLSRDFDRVFDITPNPKGSKLSREALDERTPSKVDDRNTEARRCAPYST